MRLKTSPPQAKRNLFIWNSKLKILKFLRAFSAPAAMNERRCYLFLLLFFPPFLLPFAAPRPFAPPLEEAFFAPLPEDFLPALAVCFVALLARPATLFAAFVPRFTTFLLRRAPSLAV